ncbi:MAG: TlpA family protein disulfide reductase [Dehalococcoidia bacterium]
MAVDVRRLLIVIALVAGGVAAMWVFVLGDPADEEAGFTDAQIVEATAEPSRAVPVGLRDGEQAPDFEISRMDGTRVRLSDFRGQPVVISFFALWCGGCLAEMPVLQSAQSERGVDHFTVLAVNAGETRERAQEFIDIIDAPFVWTLDFDLTVSDAYGVHGLPHTVFIDAEGIVRTTYAGATNRVRLDTYLDAVVRGTEPAPLPNELRFVTRIPRDHVLDVDVRDASTVVLSSRRLRCDVAYCADSVSEALLGTAGVLAVSAAAGRTADESSLEVRFDSETVTAEALVETVVALLDGLPDPLFRGVPLVVRTGSGDADAERETE